MSGEKSCDGVSKKRNPLGDVTNLVGKREFLAISGDAGCEIENWEKGVSVKKVCLGVENVEKLNSLVERVSNDKDRGKEVLEISGLKDNFSSDILNAYKEHNQKKSPNKIFQHCRVDDVSQSVAGVLKDSCVASIAKPTNLGVLDSLDVGGSQLKDGGVCSQGEQSTNVCEKLDTDVGENELGVDNLESSKFEFTDCLRFPESQESRSSDPERCVGLKGDGSSDSPVGIDLIKACSCSFCTKASYIWSDLHYQDVKGRLTALKKSHKEANILVQRSTQNKAIDVHGPGKPNVFKLQSSLMGQWRSLFLHMEEIFGQESSQLESSLHTLKDLRDNCKNVLESINEMPSK